ncbi:MAG: polyphosphate kinase 1 [Bacteroidetes bacterium]|nr:MAG: polyphosphate kinase 1 [Bacteroidota bacterium]
MTDDSEHSLSRSSSPKSPRRRPARKTRKSLPPPPRTPNAADPSLFINRELSWLEFNHRVLEEAMDRRHPLLERVKFLSIVSSNLDEFFMIRVAAIREQIIADFVEYSPDGLMPREQMSAIHERVSRMVRQMSDCFWNDLHPELRSAGVTLLTMDELSAEQRRAMSDVFAAKVFPVLTPLAFDPGHPFPYISNLSLNLAVVVVTGDGEEKFARVKVPDVLPRLMPLPDDPSDPRAVRFVWLEDLIAANLGMLFPGMEVKESYQFRVTRNADIEIQEDEAEDLISSIEESLRLRRYGSVVRVGVQDAMPARIRKILTENLEVTAEDVYPIRRPLGLSHLMSLLKLPRPELKDPPYTPALPLSEEGGDDMFALIRRGDVLLFHPYDSFAPVVQFIKNAVSDPDVLAIKQTLYRIGKESPLIPLLIEAAENGKQVAVLVELKARFDEENNIGWAKQLEGAGVHVVYGLVGLKTHAKMAMVVRKERGELRRYVHLGTGNYNPHNARIYTDHSLFSCSEAMTGDVAEVFNLLTGYSRRDTFPTLAVAPVTLRRTLQELMEREIRHARAGRPGRMILKANSLTDQKVIETLYEASAAGVSVDLIIRGVCCLRPGIPGVSENIRAVSIVGRYLEHSRVYWFGNGGAPEVYLSSADLMGRNLDRRVELMFPVLHPRLAAQVYDEALRPALEDTVGARTLDAQGRYERRVPPSGTEPLDSQQSVAASRQRSGAAVKLVLRDTPPAV